MALQTEPESTALETLDLLEARLRRLEFIVTGQTRLSSQKPPSKHEQTIRQRMHNLEHSLQALASGSSVVSDLLHLQSYRNPKFFPVPSNEDNEAAPPPSTLAARTMVLATAPAFQETISQLRSLSDLDLADDHASSSVSLVHLQPRLARAAQLQDLQERDILQLRKRSAAVLKSWYEVGILGQGECLVDWEERLRDVEKKVRQQERARERDDIVG